MKRLRLLFVDDSEDFRAMMPLMYGSLASVEEVRTASDLSEALEALSEFDADIVFLDSLMPDMSGEDVAERIRASHPESRLVALTGLPASETTWADTTITKGAQSHAEVRALIESVSRES